MRHRYFQSLLLSSSSLLHEVFISDRLTREHKDTFNLRVENESSYEITAAYHHSVM